ncbi:MAG: PepSY-associated TM helix domain-containing protein [Rhodoferax sp.]
MMIPHAPAPQRRQQSFRLAMDQVHTWAGVVFGGLLFAMFLMGTLAVFDREIDRWAQPHTRLAAPAATDGPGASLDQALAALERIAPDKAAFWLIYPPSERNPALRLGWSGKDMERGLRDMHPVTGELLPEQGAALGTQLFYPFHYSLHLKWLDLGEWLAGLAAMAMLVAVVSGVATHRRIFKDFFTFRPRKTVQRTALDLHNITAVFALPFHFVIAMSGLIVLMALYLQPAIAWIYGGDKAAYPQEVLSRYSRAAAKRPLQHRVSVDALAQRARAHWDGAGQAGAVALVIVRQPRDAHAVVEVRRAQGRRVALEQGTLYFDAASGELLHVENLSGPARVQRFITGMHLIQVEHWPLRALYFLMGLSGCVMLASGSIAWVQKRAPRQGSGGASGAAWVQALTVASVCGLLLASVGVMLLNSLPGAWWTGDATPLAASMRWFFGLWAASLCHAVALRHGQRHGQRHWRQQCLALCATSVAAVLANWIGAGAASWGAPSAASWAWRGVDLALLVVAMAAAYAAWRLRPQSPAADAASAPGRTPWFQMRWRFLR